MRILFTYSKIHLSVKQSIAKGFLRNQRCVFGCRKFSQEFSHEFEDEEPENQEVLSKLRVKHFHGVRTPLKKVNDVMVIEPDFKWGRNRFRKATASHRLDEACGLVNAITNWRVQSKSIESVRKMHGKTFFGKGKLQELTEKIHEATDRNALDAVYIDIARLSTSQYRELEKVWKVKLLDRFGIVLQIFKERANTGEAKIQVELAEIPYIRSRLVGDESVNYDQQRGGTHYIAGSGETQLEKEHRVLSDRQTKLKKKLESLKKQRSKVRLERHKRNVPIVSIVGYTNAGKTSLIKSLTGDVKMQPENKLFATLDVTAHAGKLPSGLHALFIDTVGFVSDLPHQLVDSFNATLEDVLNSDLIVHVQDASHPDRESQRDDVINILQNQLKIKSSLLDNMIEVNNKIDLCSEELLSELSEPKNLHISATEGTGLDVLRSKIEKNLIKTTDRRIIKVVIPPGGPQLSWLYREATIHKTVSDEDGFITATVIMDNATYSKFENKFGSILEPFVFQQSPSDDKVDKGPGDETNSDK